MTKKILITYASKTGWTIGVAEAIGKTLCESGAQVTVLPMKDVKTLEEYDAVVAGSAINGRAWLPEAVQFVQKNQAELAQKPVATFLICMTLAMRNGEQFRSQVADWIAPVRAMLKPVSEAQFAGGLDIGNMPSAGDRLKFRISVLFGVWKEGDHRDWNAIHQWAMQLKSILGA